MGFPLTRSPDGQLKLLTGVLFIAYLCVGMALPVVPVFVTGPLALGNVWAGLAVGGAFFTTIITRGYAGKLSDSRGAKAAVARGLQLYVAGAVLALLAGLPAISSGSPMLAFAILLIGRLVFGLGESMAAVGIVAWGIGIVGLQRSSKVLAWMGAAMYGALALGGPLGLVLLQYIGFAGAMAVSGALPVLGLLVVWSMEGVPAHPEVKRPPFWTVLGRVWSHGSIVCLQGIGFAAIGAFFALHFMKQNWAHAGLGLTAFGSGFVLVRILCGHLPDRVGGLPVAIVSLGVETVGQLLIWSAGDPTLALVGAFLTGLGCSMIFPSMGREVVHLVEPHLRGTALGAFSAFQDLSYGLTGPIAGLLADRAGYGSVYLVGAVAAATGLLVALVLRARERRLA